MTNPKIVNTDLSRRCFENFGGTLFEAASGPVVTGGVLSFILAPRTPKCMVYPINKAL